MANGVTKDIMFHIENDGHRKAEKNDDDSNDNSNTEKKCSIVSSMTPRIYVQNARRKYATFYFIQAEED